MNKEVKPGRASGKISGRQEERLWMGLGGEDDDRRMGELEVESKLKSKIIGIKQKQKEDKIFIKQNDNNVGRVKKQVVRF